jgi:hypothetical protein
MNEWIHIVTDSAVSRKRISKHVHKRSRIGAHFYAAVVVLWFTARSAILTVESPCPRQRIIQSAATEGLDKINCWERCRIFGRLKAYVKRQKSDTEIWRRRQKGKSRIWECKLWSRVPRDSDPRMAALARASSNCKQRTRPLVRESSPTSTNPQLSDSNKNLVISPRWVLDTKTDWPTDRRS